MKTHMLVAGLVALLGFTGQAAVIQFSADLAGPNENPPNASLGFGSALVTFDTVAHTLMVYAEFGDLVGTTTVAHIHCCVDAPGNVGVAIYPGTFPGFPVGVTSGTYFSPIFDLLSTTSYSASFLTNFGGGTALGAEAALLSGLLDGRAYFNIHTTTFPGGEIRGFLSEVRPVPEPGTLTLVGFALATGGLWRRRMRRT